MPKPNVNSERGASEVLQAAIALIENPAMFVRDNVARGWNDSEVKRGAHNMPNAVPGSCMPTAAMADRWNGAGAIWRQLRDFPEAAVREAYDRFVAVIGSSISVSRWCSEHEHADHLAALAKAAA